MQESFVYILECRNNGARVYYYTGMSTRIAARLEEHRNKRCRTTKRFNGNVSIGYLERFEARTKTEAISIAHGRELKIKNIKRNKKEMLMRLNRNRTIELMERYIDVSCFN